MLSNPNRFLIILISSLIIVLNLSYVSGDVTPVEEITSGYIFPKDNTNVYMKSQDIYAELYEDQGYAKERTEYTLKNDFNSTTNLIIGLPFSGDRTVGYPFPENLIITVDELLEKCSIISSFTLNGKSL